MARTIHRLARGSYSARRWLVSMFTALATVAAVVGALVAYGRTDSRISLLGWTWETGDISETVAAWLMIGGGSLATLLAAGGLNLDRPTSNRRMLALELILVVGGIVATIAGVTILI